VRLTVVEWLTELLPLEAAVTVTWYVPGAIVPCDAPAPQFTVINTVPNRSTSSSISIAFLFLPTTTNPSMPKENIEAKIPRKPCRSSALRVTVPPPLPEIVTVIVDDGTDVPSMANDDGDAEQFAGEGTVQLTFKV
jgi:hypothetical protein